LTLSSSNYNTIQYITNAAFNGITFPASTATSAGGNYWTLRNATNTQLSITVTNVLNLTTPLILPSNFTQTFVISSVTASTLLTL
jgi:hypothetical protein